jgi:ATP-dependent Clp protease ATP-binding subunit ClpC
MFERYTESARRTLFFARYEASQTGSRAIETEHVLLGLLRELPGITGKVFDLSHVQAEDLRKDIERRVVFREKYSTSVEIPFSPATKLALQASAEEADRLGHSYIGSEHLLLGLLVDEGSMAASVLTGHGLRLPACRRTIAELTSSEHAATTSSPGPAVLRFTDVPERVAAIKRLVAELVKAPRDSAQAHQLAENINAHLDQLENRAG